MLGKDNWTYIWGTPIFSTSKAYKAMIGHKNVHPIYTWLWKSICQIKHKVFFWLLLKNQLSTRELLRRKQMELDSYTCELCILQKTESMAHLFLRCNFAKACCNSIGITITTTRPVQDSIFRQIRSRLAVPFFMEIIIVMTWSIWTTSND